MAAVTADTWATELGVLAAQPPRLITTGRRVAPGASGGVTPAGTLAALAGAGFIGVVGALLRPTAPFLPEWLLWPPSLTAISAPMWIGVGAIAGLGGRVVRQRAGGDRPGDVLLRCVWEGDGAPDAWVWPRDHVDPRLALDGQRRGERAGFGMRGGCGGVRGDCHDCIGALPALESGLAPSLPVARSRVHDRLKPRLQIRLEYRLLRGARLRFVDPFFSDIESEHGSGK